MAEQSSVAFALSVGAHEPAGLVVTGFSGTEALSQPFEFHIDFFPKDDAPLEGKELLGAKASLEIQAKGGSRHVHGLVHRVEALGEHGGKHRYRLRVTPEIERLKHVRRSRIFQEKATPDIVASILAKANIEHRLSLQGNYPPREYCVQYRETDFAFISRLLEWEGIFYFFEHSEEGHVLVLGDAPSAHAELPGGATLPFRHRDGRQADEEHVHALEQSHRIRSGAVVVRDFDFKKPALDLTASANTPGGFTALEVYDYPTGAVALGDGKRVGKVRLQEKQQQERTYAGASATPRLCPGFTFEVEHSETGVVHGEFLAVEVRHSGRRPEARGHLEVLGQSLYQNEFSCMPADVPFRPRRLTPKPVVPGIQTATVTGPGGAEIHPDEHGRIKVQFHWDREGKQDDRSSCWIRVGQVWGGPAWGGLFLPRIGQEVVIRFLEGDPDRPLLTGAVYNGQNPTPYSLPDEKTKSTLKSASSPGSDGFNELRFEDAAEKEELFIHAQKDELLITENDKFQQVRNDESLLVEKDRKKTVEGNQRLQVSQQDVGWVGMDQTQRVTGNRETATNLNHDESVDGNQSISVMKERHVNVTQTVTTTVEAAAALAIGAESSVSVALVSSLAVGGFFEEQVGGNWTEYVRGSRSENIDKDRSAKVGGMSQTEVTGHVSMKVGKDVSGHVNGEEQLKVKEPAAWLAKTFSLETDKLSLVVGGKLILSVKKSGEVELHASSVSLDGSKVVFKGAHVKMESAGSVSDKSLQWDEIETLTAPEPSYVEFTLKDFEGKALANTAYEVTLADGTVRKGKTNGSGKVKLEKVPAGQYTVAFSEIDGEVRKG